MVFGSILALMVILSVVTLLIKVSRQPGINEGNQNSLNRLFAMRELMWLFQTHRGKSIAYMSGDKSVLPEVRGIQSKIEAAIKKLSEPAGTTQENGNWVATQVLWHQVFAKWRKNTVEMNFKMHNALIRQHMFAMEDEIALLESNKESAIDSEFSSSLLNIIEFMGQTRAIGTNVTSSGKCQSIAKIRLCYLSQKLQSSATDIKGHDGIFEQREKLVMPIVSCVKERLLTADNLMSTKEWFSLCTQSIDALYRCFDQSIQNTTLKTK